MIYAVIDTNVLVAAAKSHKPDSGPLATLPGPLVILSENRPFCHLQCRFVHFSGIGPGFAIPLCGSDKELRE